MSVHEAEAHKEAPSPIWGVKIVRLVQEVEHEEPVYSHSVIAARHQERKGGPFLIKA